MSIKITISKIKRELISTIAALDSWFDRDEELLQEKPAGKWSAAEMLEHVMLTNHYLLMLIEKGTDKAMALAKERDVAAALVNYTFNVAGMEAIGNTGAFAWDHPKHMTPTGAKPLAQVRQELRHQLFRCICSLDMLAQGEGVLYTITMSVNNLGKLDVYQYLYFLALHAKRHLEQLERREAHAAH